MAKTEEKKDEDKKGLPETVTRTENYDFDRKFTKEEIDSKSAEVVRKFKEKAQLTKEKQAAVSEFKSKMDECEKRIGQLTDEVSSGKERVTRTCDAVLDYNTGIKTYFYEGEIVGSKKLTRADYQVRASDFEKTFEEGTKEAVIETAGKAGEEETEEEKTEE